MPHNQTLGGLTYFSHVSVACLKFIFGSVAAQHCCRTLTWQRAMCHIAGQREGDDSHLPIQTPVKAGV